MILTSWFSNIVNYLFASVFPPLASKAQKDKIKSDAKHFMEALRKPALHFPHPSQGT